MWGESDQRPSRQAGEEPSRAALLGPHPRQGQSEILGNDLNHLLCFLMYPCLLYQKRGRTRLRLVAPSAPSVWLLGPESAPGHSL